MMMSMIPRAQLALNWLKSQTIYNFRTTNDIENVATVNLRFSKNFPFSHSKRRCLLFSEGVKEKLPRRRFFRIFMLWRMETYAKVQTQIPFIIILLHTLDFRSDLIFIFVLCCILCWMCDDCQQRIKEWKILFIFRIFVTTRERQKIIE